MPSPEAELLALGQQLSSEPGPADRILAEAVSLFYQHGIRGVGIDLVIARAKVAKASLYRHFPSKRDLIVAYVDRREEAFRSWLRAQVEARADSPQAQLLAIFDLLIELCADPGFRGSASANAVVEVGEEYPEVIDRAVAHRQHLKRWIEHLAYDAHCDDPSGLSDRWMLLIDAALHCAQTQRDGVAARTARNIAAELIGPDPG